MASVWSLPGSCSGWRASCSRRSWQNTESTIPTRARRWRSIGRPERHGSTRPTTIRGDGACCPGTGWSTPPIGPWLPAGYAGPSFDPERQDAGHVRSTARGDEIDMTVKRMDNVGIVVESLDVAIAFFAELGLRLEGRATIEGEWAGRVTGLGNQHVEIAMMVTPDGHSRLELSRFLTPPVVADHRNAPVNALGYLRVMFTVADIDETLTRLQKIGAQLVGEVVKYEEAYRLCYIRGPEGLLIGLAEQLTGNRNPL